MAFLRIPQLAQEGFRRLALLSDEQFQELYAALQSIPLEIRHHTVFVDQAIKSPSIPEQDLESIRNTLYPLLLSGPSVSVSTSDYVKDVVSALEREDEALPKELAPQLRDRLNKLLSVPSLQLLAKSYEVLTEHGFTYSKAQILTDIRCVFGEDVDASPEAAVIVHMLNLDYTDGSHRKTFVIALDNKDVQELSEVLERAKKKAKTLKSLIESTKATYIDVT